MTSRLAARRAVEALRSGVPSRDAVAALGSGQGDIEDTFLGLLDGAAGMRTHARGMLLGGGFGAGKSHVLEHLAHLALERGFVVSRIVVSKETPLHDPAKVLRAAVESAVTPEGAVGAVAEAAASLDPESPAFAELLRWASGTGAPVDEWFPLTLSLFRGYRAVRTSSPRRSCGIGPATGSRWRICGGMPSGQAWAGLRWLLCPPGTWRFRGCGSWRGCSWPQATRDGSCCSTRSS